MENLEFVQQQIELLRVKSMQDEGEMLRRLVDWKANVIRGEQVAAHEKGRISAFNDVQNLINGMKE